MALVLALVCVSASSARADDSLRSVPPLVDEIGRNPFFHVPGDTIEIVARRGFPPGSRSVFARYPFLATTEPGIGRPSPASLLRPRTYRLSRFGCVMDGAGLGARSAAALGGIGLVTGAFGEQTGFWLIGAGAVMGALWGGTFGSEDEGFRIRVDARTGPSDPEDLLPLMDDGPRLRR